MAAQRGTQDRFPPRPPLNGYVDQTVNLSTTTTKKPVRFPGGEGRRGRGRGGEEREAEGMLRYKTNDEVGDSRKPRGLKRLEESGGRKLRPGRMSVDGRLGGNRVGK